MSALCKNISPADIVRSSESLSLLEELLSAGKERSQCASVNDKKDEEKNKGTKVIGGKHLFEKKKRQAFIR